MLRGAPGIDGEPIGGVDYNEQVVVIEDSADKQWQRIRIEGSDREGWVKAGNLSRVNWRSVATKADPRCSKRADFFLRNIAIFKA